MAISWRRKRGGEKGWRKGVKWRKSMKQWPVINGHELMKWRESEASAELEDNGRIRQAVEGNKVMAASWRGEQLALGGSQLAAHVRRLTPVAAWSFNNHQLAMAKNGLRKHFFDEIQYSEAAYLRNGEMKYEERYGVCHLANVKI
jgi:hypothetical protein